MVKELIINFSLVIECSVAQNMRIFCLKQLRAKECLENLIIMIGVTVWNVPHLMVIVICVELCFASLIWSVGTCQTLFRKDKLLLFKIQTESIISLPLWDKAVVFSRLLFG